MTQHIIEEGKQYRWQAYGHVATVQALSSYNGTDGGEIVRVKLVRVITRPANDFFSKEMPVAVDELTPQN